MKTIMFLGAAAALSLGVGLAYARNEGASANTKGPIPNVVAQRDPAQSAPPNAADSLQEDGRIASARRHDRQLILLH